MKLPTSWLELLRRTNQEPVGFRSPLSGHTFEVLTLCWVAAICLRLFK
jgi:hypothetical protein